MSDPFITEANRGKYFLVGAAIGGAVFVVALVVVVMAFNFTSYQSSGGLPSGDTPPAQVAIGSPQKGAVLDAGESLLVKATAIGSTAFSSMELWVDGELTGVQAAPSAGAHPFSTSFYWLPLEPGRHSLIAAAIDVDGQRAMSAQVLVSVTPAGGRGEILTTGQAGSHVVLPAPAGGGAGSPEAPGAGDLVGPADDWSGSPGDWVTSLITDEKPVPPELVASAGLCSADLLIHDLSDNEQGFIVYRLTPNATTWQQVAILDSQSQNNWLTYTDSDQSGAITYYVSAFNSQGEAGSNLALVNINPTDCAPESGKYTASFLEVTLQMPNNAGGLTYCYQSTDGVSWARWPQFGFLTPDEDGFVTGAPVVQLLHKGIEGESAIPRLGLYMECWGWQDGALVQLGDFFVEDMHPQSIGSQFVPGEGLSAEVEFIPVELVGGSEFYPVGPETTGGSDFVSQQDQLELQTWISPEIPRVVLDQTTNPEQCKNHLPPDEQNSVGQSIYCSPYPEFDPNLGAVSSQPYLVWNFDSCLAGSGENCKSYAELLALAETNGGQVGFNVTSLSNAGSFIWPVTEPYLRMFVVPPLGCTGNVEYNVRLWYRPGDKSNSPYTTEDEAGIDPESPYATAGDTPAAEIQEIYYGPPSNWVSIPCIPPNVNKTVEFEYTQYLDITFETIELFEVDDGDVYIDSPQDIELYGYFKVLAPSMGQELEIPCLFEAVGMCDPENTWTVYTRRMINVADWDVDPGAWPCTGCTKLLRGGHHDISEWSVCQSTSKKSCSYEGQPTAYMVNNNTIRVFVTDGEELYLEVNLIDYDENSENDTICWEQETIPGRSLAEWANTQNEAHTIYGGMTDSGWCTVEYVINAVAP